MNLRFLVVGNSTDCGKTAVSTSLVRTLRKRGSNCCGFKPSGSTTLYGNTSWILDALQSGRLYGADCAALKKASETSLSEEFLGPNYILGVNGGRAFPEPNPAYQPPEAGPFLVERYALWTGTSTEIVFVVNKPEAELSGVAEILKLPNAKIITKKAEYQEIYDLYARRAMRASYDYLAEKHDSIVIESRSDLASSFYAFESKGCSHDLDRLDLVLYVRPYFITCYSGSEYLDAVQKNLRESPVNRIYPFPRSDSVLAKHVVKALKPIKEFRSPILRPQDASKLDEVLNREVPWPS